MFGPIFWKMEHGDPLILFHFLTACAINNRFWQKKNWHIFFDPKLSQLSHLNLLKVKGVWRAQSVIEACLLTTRSKMFRQHLKCSLTAPRRAGTSSGFFCFFLLSQLSEPWRLGTALSGPASRLASAMTFSGCDTSPTWRQSTAVHFQSVERRVQRNLEGLANVRLDELTVVRRHWLFFFFLMVTRRRGLGERGDKILRWRHSNCTHYDACRRETAWVFPETLRSASRKTERPFQAQSVSHRTD